MDGVISGIGVVYVAMGVESFERGIELLNENEKLRKGYWVFVIFFARIFVIDLLLLFLLRLDL